MNEKKHRCLSKLTNAMEVIMLNIGKLFMVVIKTIWLFSILTLIFFLGHVADY